MKSVPSNQRSPLQRQHEHQTKPARSGAGRGRWLGLALALTLVWPLTACDRTSVLEEGVSTELEVRKEFGDPVTITVEPDGTRTFDYPRQPEGWTNYVIKIAPDGKVTSIRQLITPDNFAKVTPGLGKLEVRGILGRPAKQQRFDLKNEEVWDWRFREGGQESKLFSVTFDAAGQVLKTAVIEDPRGLNSGQLH